MTAVFVVQNVKQGDANLKLLKSYATLNTITVILVKINNK